MLVLGPVVAKKSQTSSNLIDSDPLKKMQMKEARVYVYV